MDDKIECIVTGQLRSATPEEFVRQDFLKLLIDDYGYSKDQIQLEYGVKRSPSDTKKSLPVDIAIFENGIAKIFVETKKPSVTEGFSQLKDYMNFDSDVKFGVWTNGGLNDDEINIKYGLINQVLN